MIADGPRTRDDGIEYLGNVSPWRGGGEPTVGC